MPDSNTRNLIITMVAVLAIMGIWQILVWGPEQKAAQEAFAANQAEKALSAPSEVVDEDATSGQTGPDGMAFEDTSDDVRLAFEGPSVDGSILLRGARLDELKLKNYYDTLEGKEALDPEDEVEVLDPQGAGTGYYAAIGWKDMDGRPLVDANTQWSLVSGTTLTPTSPVTLGWQGETARIERKIELDDRFMFTYTDTVTNTGSEPLSIAQYGVLRQFGVPEDLANFYILHEGLVGAVGGELILEKYKQLAKGAMLSRAGTEGGWIGLTDKYWLTALVPDQSQPFTLTYRTIQRGGGQVLQAGMDGVERVIQPGASATSAQRIFSGAKKNAVLSDYEDSLGIPRFNDAIDWGKYFFWLTEPFFTVLSFINGYVGNFGVSILLLTVLVKLIFFPIQNKAYASMAKMKELQEPMKEIRERYAADKQRQQQEIMKLYKERKVNPVAGCLPILIQIPVFYALYKTLFVTIEMRHQPFFGWIRDLSAPDPSAIGNLFGLLPISAEALGSVPLLGVVLTIGILPILYGFTMWLLQSLSPPPGDATQKLIFSFLPIIFTFVFAGFAAGLVIYWCWSNILSILQQYVIMRRNGVKTEFDKFLAKRFGRKDAKA